MSSDKGGSDSMTRAELQERFEFRNVRAEEADQTIVSRRMKPVHQNL